MKPEIPANIAAMMDKEWEKQTEMERS